MSLWTPAELIEATGGALSAPFTAEGVSIDTRTLQPNDLFIALLGEGRDGHAFVAAAIAKGAAGAMVHGDVASEPVLRVDDTLAGLQRLGAFARSRFTGDRVAAITGSVGKTTSKEMLRSVLSVFGPTHAATASYNNHWGVPLTLARMPRDTRYLVAEIGMNHPGEIAPLSRLVRPHVALITTIARAHVGHMGGIEGVADEKASIAAGLEPNGIAVLPIDSDQFARLCGGVGKAQVLTFGANTAADIRLLAAASDADGSRVEADLAGRTVAFRINAPGAHMAMNAVAVLATVVAMGLDPMAAIAGLEAFEPLAGRGQRRVVSLPDGELLLLDESYNANGASMRAAFDVLRLQTARRRIAVLGDMLELGEEGPAEHAGLAESLGRSADLLFACGPLMRHLFDAVPAAMRAAHAANSQELAPIVAAAIAAGDAVLVKGSLGSRMKRVVQAIDGAASMTPSPAGAV
ncbi:MAG TPA: UDP-N-acetylmuramoyl-tripeptide--D-alanyl-D-alanine ligase [Rhodopila sp.]|nr:UDP-N-acetylmuramoyl-tripeptide--D-alanyl-D-alanine ligase [Rhodopila sp.]